MILVTAEHCGTLRSTHTHTAVVLATVLLLSVSTSPKVLVTEECYYMVIITYIRVNRMARRLEVAQGSTLGGGSGGGLVYLRDIFT
jgi:hypothetical protein